jgi:hypothetical protein
MSQSLPHTNSASLTHQKSHAEVQHQGDVVQRSAAHGSHPGSSGPPASQTVCSQVGHEQSAGQSRQVSPALHDPSPHAHTPQSGSQEAQVSAGNSHAPFPHVQAPQSVAHDRHVSPASQPNIPHTEGQKPQSPGQLAQSSNGAP